MNAEELRECLLGFPRVTEETPFDAETVVYKTSGKMFALIDWNIRPLRMNLKCEPDLALELRDRHRCVQPGYHMNKKHWNTVVIDGSVEDDTLRQWVSHSFERVLAGMPKKMRDELKQEHQSMAGQGRTPADPQLRDSLKKGI